MKKKGTGDMAGQRLLDQPLTETKMACDFQPLQGQ